MSFDSDTDAVSDAIKRFSCGDDSVKDFLIASIQERFRQTASQLLRQNPAVRRWELTDDVLQGALVRFSKSIDDLKPESLPAFLSLMRLQYVREIVDLARRHYGPNGVGKNTKFGCELSDAGVSAEDETNGPESIQKWTEFQDAIERLESPFREVFEMSWFQMLTHQEMATALNCSTKTIQRQFREACVQMRSMCENPKA